MQIVRKTATKNVTEMQNRRDTIPNQWTKPASNAGLMDKGHRMASGTMDDVTRLAIGRIRRNYLDNSMRR